MARGEGIAGAAGAITTDGLAACTATGAAWVDAAGRGLGAGDACATVATTPALDVAVARVGVAAASDGVVVNTLKPAGEAEGSRFACA